MTRVTAWGVAAAATVALGSCGGSEKVSSSPPATAPANLHLTSTAFDPGAAIPRRYTCVGDGERPPLRFAGVPRAARELALLVVDPDAGGFVHWTVYGIAPSVRMLDARGLPRGAREGANSTGRTGWTPPCPPNGTHRYEFELYWLRGRTKLAPGADPKAVIEAISAGAGGRGELVGRFGRGT